MYLHPTDALAHAHRTTDQLRHQAAIERQLPRRPSRRVVSALVATVLGAGLVAGPATATVRQATDTYTGGDKQVQGLVDGWFDPTDRPVEVADNGTYR